MTSDQQLLEKQIWETKLGALLSLFYYRLKCGTYQKWRTAGIVLLVITVLVSVGFAAKYQEAWLRVVGTATIPFLLCLIDIGSFQGKLNNAQRMHEKWSEFSHDTSALWDRVRASKPAWTRIKEDFIHLSERQRSMDSQDHTPVNRNRRVLAERMVYEEHGLPYEGR